MVVVQTVDPSPIAQTTNMFSQLWNFFCDAWVYMLAGLIILILGVVAYYLLVKSEEEKKERDDIVYESYKNTVRDCVLQADNSKIQKTWRPINLLWFGIPILKREHSKRVLNYENRLLGYYRGECFKMEGTRNLLVYKIKKLIFFEQDFVIKIPHVITVKTKQMDKATGEVLINPQTKEPIVKTYRFDFKNFVELLPDGNIKIHCTHLEKVGFYRIPVFIDKNKNIIDIRREMGDKVMDSGWAQMISRVLSVGAQQVEKAMEHNPALRYEQMSPKKTKTEQAEEKREPVY